MLSYRVCNHKRTEKKLTLKKKFTALQRNITKVREPEHTYMNFVVNKSKQTFTTEEMDLLNHGLKYKPAPAVVPIEEIVVNIESAIQYLPFKEKSSIRFQCEKLLNDTKPLNNKKAKKEREIIDLLKKKECIFTRADKSNEVVIMEKNDYEEAMKKLISEGPYVEIKLKRKFPVDKYAKEFKDDLDKLISEGILEPKERWKFVVRNASIPKLYGLPKTHKEGNKMRPIVSNVGAPCSRLAKHLAAQAEKFKPPDGFSIKNSKEFVEKLKTVEIQEDEEMVSFDVEALFPSVPTTEALNEINNWVDSQQISDKEAEKFFELTKICLNQSYLQWRGKIFKQSTGLSMGNSLSPLAANVFMSSLEVKASKKSWFPRVWYRYVDDVFTIIKKGTASEILAELNNLSPSINFTFEKEANGKLPFLDIMLIRAGRKLEFDIYRKPTQVPLYIPKSSNHPQQHKQAAFHSMVHRLFSVPLNDERKKKEIEHIKWTARVNGYQEIIIDNIIEHQQNKEKLKKMTTLQRDPKPLKTIKLSNGHHKQIFAEIPRCEPYSFKLEKILRKHGVNTYNSSNGNLKSLICSLKDCTNNQEKSGIYEIDCQNCCKKYRGQTSRRIADRYTEHERAWRLKNPSKSAIAQHCIEEQHTIGTSKLLKEVRDNRKLDAWESLLIMKGDELVNVDEPPITSQLFVIADKFKTIGEKRRKVQSESERP